MRPFPFIKFQRFYSKIFYCHGLGSAKNDEKLIKKWTEMNSLEFQKIKYSECNGDRRIWTVENWVKDVTKELQKQQKRRKLIAICVSASAQAFLRSVWYKPSLLNGIEGLLLISPGVGMKVDNYIRRVFTLEEKELLKEGLAVEHPTTNNEFSGQIKIDLKSLEDYAQNCVLHINNQRPTPLFDFPVRIVHGIHDKIVPFSNSLNLLGKIKSNDKAILQANSGHLINVN
uniref:Hydrolase_4 domain-containing protein n=1 Tax=Meloidogyne hapla TaxID=6305 RepID=A0A1I8AYA9_MELHA